MLTKCVRIGKTLVVLVNGNLQPVVVCGCTYHGAAQEPPEAFESVTELGNAREANSALDIGD